MHHLDILLIHDFLRKIILRSFLMVTLALILIIIMQIINTVELAYMAILGLALLQVWLHIMMHLHEMWLLRHHKRTSHLLQIEISLH
jgi:heme/copper-type cytochrome/quinol oxidase subunit 4